MKFTNKESRIYRWVQGLSDVPCHVCTPCWVYELVQYIYILIWCNKEIQLFNPELQYFSNIESAPNQIRNYTFKTDGNGSSRITHATAGIEKSTLKKD